MEVSKFKHKIIKQKTRSDSVGTIFIFPEFWGNTEFIFEVSERYSKLGYDSVQIDLYSEQYRPQSPAEATVAFEGLSQNFDPLFASIIKLIDENNLSNKLNAIGFSAGSIVMLRYQEKYNIFQKMITAYGRMPTSVGLMSGKILVLNGLSDLSVKQSDIEYVISKVKGPNKLVNYENAKHMFLNPLAQEIAAQFARPVEYNPQIEQLAWTEIEGFLD